MFPDLFTAQTASGPLGFHTYGLFLTLAFFAAVVVGGRRMKRAGQNPDRMVPLSVIAILAGIAGARLLHFLGADWELFRGDPLVFFRLSEGGMAFLGGPILAGFAGLIYVKWAGLHPWKMMDIIFPCVLLGLAVGRLGCFSAGCCHGAVCDVAVTQSITGGLFPGGEIVLVSGFPWVAFSYHSGVGVGAIFETPLFPTQMWESLGAFSLFGVLSWVWYRQRRFDGLVTALTLMTYPLLRSTIELYRGDTLRGVEHVAGLSTSQLASIPVFALGVFIILWRRGKGLDPEEVFETPDEDLLDEDLLDEDLLD